MRDIKNLKKLSKQKRKAKTPPVITGGTTQIDLALDAAAESGDFSATLPGPASRRGSRSSMSMRDTRSLKQTADQRSISR
jgi:hypothetical protein